MGKSTIALGAVGALALAAPARAESHEPTIVTTAGASWSSIVTAIEDDPATQGTTYALRVEVAGKPIACGDYTLALDDVGARAFHLETCDARTRATTLRVVARDALFEPGDPVPHARKTSIHAAIVQRGDAEGGGADPPSGAGLYCTVALQPYLWDALVGRPVELTPDRYAIVTHDTIDVIPAVDGWVARGPSKASLRFTYEVSDRHTHAVVLTAEATLQCASTPTTAHGTTPTPTVPRPERRNTQFHADMYMLGIGRFGVHDAPIVANGQRMTGGEFGVDHVTTFGFTPYVAPHLGFGIETWHWLFYVDGGYELWGTTSGSGHSDSASHGFVQVEQAARMDLGPVILSLGPSVGVRWLEGIGWRTGARTMVGADAELRLHVGGGGGKHGPPTMSMDWFLRCSTTFLDGFGWSINFGEGWGSLRDDDRR